MLSGYHEFLLIVGGLQVARGSATIVGVAQTQAFQIFVEKARESDYLSLSENSVSDYRVLKMSRSVVTAAPGAFRYDLLCKPRTRLSAQLPVCEFCTERGHIQFFCAAKKISAS